MCRARMHTVTWVEQFADQELQLQDEVLVRPFMCRSCAGAARKARTVRLRSPRCNARHTV